MHLHLPTYTSSRIYLIYISQKTSKYSLGFSMSPTIPDYFIF